MGDVVQFKHPKLTPVDLLDEVAKQDGLKAVLVLYMDDKDVVRSAYSGMTAAELSLLIVATMKLVAEVFVD